MIHMLGVLRVQEAKHVIHLPDIRQLSADGYQVLRAENSPKTFLRKTVISFSDYLSVGFPLFQFLSQEIVV